MRWPIRNQIMWPLMAVALVSLAGVGAFNAQLATRRTRAQIESQLQGVVGVLDATNFPLTDAVLRQMRDLSRAEFALVDTQGAVRAASFAEPPPLTADAPPVKPSEVALGPTVNVAGRSYFHTAIELHGLAPARSDRVLHVFFPQAEYRRSWREAFIPPLVIGIDFVIAVAAVAHVVASRLSRGASRLGSEVLRMAHGDFAAAPLPKTDDEIRDLSIAINRTAEMLADYERQVRRTEQTRTAALLGASLAHEMRNAATGCLMALDLHAEGCPGANEEESLAVAKRQLRLMESQLQRLLQVGKASSAARRSTVDLRGLVENLLPLVQPAAHHADVQLDWLPPAQPLNIDGDKEQLSQVVLNLILNALEAARHDESAAGDRRVGVELRSAEGQVQFSVSDTGPGPNGEVTATLFDPFVTTKPEGAGLGLAVARQVVEAHAGTIDWRRAGGVTLFSVRLPLTTKGESFVKHPGR